MTVPAFQDEILEEKRFNHTVDFIMEQFEETETGKNSNLACYVMSGKMRLLCLIARAFTFVEEKITYFFAGASVFDISP